MVPRVLSVLTALFLTLVAAAPATAQPRTPGYVAYWFAWAGYLGDRAEFYEGSVSSGG